MSLHVVLLTAFLTETFYLLSFLANEEIAGVSYAGGGSSNSKMSETNDGGTSSVPPTPTQRFFGPDFNIEAMKGKQASSLYAAIDKNPWQSFELLTPFVRFGELRTNG